jgi:UDP-N-acetylglucosamine 2-epimerase (non-hydrolysing)
MKKSDKIEDAICLGTRPEISKFFPIVKKFPCFIIHTGQHSDLAKMMFDFFKITPDVDLKLMKENQDIWEFLSNAIFEIDKEVKKHSFKRLWVQGDTATALAGAIVAKRNNIKLVHLEAGLRTGYINSPFPEEINRVLIDQMSDILFAPTKRAFNNLQKENIKGNIYTVGNTEIESLNIIKKIIPNERPIKEKYILVTLHRRETFGKELEEIFKALKELSKDINIVFLCHPNPNVRKVADKIGINYIEPVNYFEFLRYLKFCELVISDSGGICEDSSSFKKKIVIMRKKTERQEIIDEGYGILIEKMEKNYILKKIRQFMKKKVNITHNPFGDSFVSDRILKIIKKNG